jgi:predicted alpha/beta hydrolase
MPEAMTIPNASPALAAETLTLIQRDGVPINALRYAARGTVRGRLMVGGTTGVPQLFYKAFAEFASARGYTTLTLDYRGIGLSRPTSLKGSRIAYLDWAHQNLAAAIEAMAQLSLPLFMVGHSFGGHAFGLLPNQERVARFYTFATRAGWHGWMSHAERLKVAFLWRVVGPLLVRWKGYLASRRLGLGEDLPLDVFRDWKHWCRYPRYFFDDPAMTHVAARFGRITTPIVAANALDYRRASSASRDAFMAGYRNAPWRPADIDRATAGLGPILVT